METIVLGNRTVAYRTYGRNVDPERPPLVLLHGAGGNHLIWPAAARHLPHTLVYALDLPGHGSSPGPSSTNISAYCEVVRDFVDNLELPWFMLAGHSMGGAIALDFALAYSHRLAGISVLGAGARLRVAHSLLDGVINDFEKTTELIVDYSYAEDTSFTEKELYLRHLRETDSIVLYQDLIASNDFDIQDRVNTIELPTLIICGAQDKMAPPRLSMSLHDDIRNSELHIIEGAGHNVLVEKPDVVAGLFQTFLDGLVEPYGAESAF